MLLQLWSSQILADASPLQLSIAGFLAAFLGFIVCQVIYNVYFHPLAAYPGPWLARASLLWRMIWSMQGRFHRVIDEQHKKYGPVFRVSPNELSFASQGSWRDIYGYKSALSGQETNIKSEFYEMFASGYKTMCVGSEQDPQIHSQMKRDLSPTFSTKAIIGQEPIIRSRIDAFLNKLDEVRKSSPNGIDITMWANIVVFDIFGEMAFGESFHAIEAGKPHFWPSLMTKHMFFITVLDNLRRYPWISWAGRKCLPALTTATRDRHAAYTQYHVEKRMAQKQPRCDFVANLIDQHDNGNMSKDQMISHASTFVIAGGDSASTFLPAFIYFISRTPHAYAKFLNEIDSTFDTYEGITAEAVLKMPYLQACISEALRIHPPGSHGFPRLAAGSYIDGYWVPRGVSLALTPPSMLL